MFAGIDPLIGRDFSEVLRVIWPEPFASQAIAIFRHTLDTGEPYRAPSTVERRANIGTVEEYDWRVERIALPDGRKGVVCYFYDLSERQRLEATLRESEERFRLMADGLPLIVWVHDSLGRQEWVNLTFCEKFGVTREEMRDNRWQMLADPEHARAYIDAFAAAVRDQTPFHGEVRARDALGQWRWLESWARPRFGPDGAFLGHVGASADVTERKRAEDALRECDRRKDEFLATLAHELRNPLAPMLSAIQLLNRPDMGAAQVHAVRDILDRQIRHMARLVDDLLDVSRITHGKLELRLQRVTLDAVVEQALDACRPHFERSPRNLVLALPAPPIALHADPVRLAQVFTNLLYNAHKYSDPGTRIELGATREGSDAVVTVRDQGIGITRDYLPHVFQMFAQDKPGLSRAQGGLGIGLALAMGLVQAHGGTIEARSRGPGHGSEFVVRLPALADGSASAPSAAAAQPGADAAGKRVLVVDDNLDAAQTLAMLLELEGCLVSVAHSGAQALALARSSAPELVLLDIGLPDMTGYAVCRALRDAAGGASLSIVALTGWGQDNDRHLTREAGFDAHLVKPVEVQVLLALVASTARSGA